MKQLTMKLASLCACAVLAGCGGGSGGGDDTNNTPTPTQQADEVVEQEIAPVAEVQTTRTMQDIIVPDGFSYDPVRDLVLNVDISTLSTDRAYISVYSQYQIDDNDRYNADYNTRVASSALVAGKGVLPLTYTEQYPTLLAEIWFYDGNDPIQKIITAQDTDFIY